ncbi:uncharacterized protein LOC142630928 [Castanea sativa]|uniref:uncharacterized protein LOC142630928 n=1 Tax=Castanea sativa TaxID=21020 RepID=UPI003F64E9A4
MVFSLIAKLSKDIVESWEVRNKYSTPAYPQGNGQAEATNNVILSGLKKRLDDAKGNLDVVDKRREAAAIKIAHYQQRLKQGYDKGVRLRPLAPGDLILRKVVGTTKNPSWGKLGPNWEGLYRITSVAGIGAYYLEDLDENVVPRPWNVNNLYRYYY